MSYYLHQNNPHFWVAFSSQYFHFTTQVLVHLQIIFSYLSSPNGKGQGDIANHVFCQVCTQRLKLLEYNCGIGGKNSPICYIPYRDHVQEALKKNKKTNYFKLMLPQTSSKLKVTLWESGTPEQFIPNVSSTIHACKQREHDIMFSRAKDTVATALLNKGLVCACLKLRERKTQREKGESTPAICKSLEAAKSSRKLHKL